MALVSSTCFRRVRDRLGYQPAESGRPIPIHNQNCSQYFIIEPNEAVQSQGLKLRGVRTIEITLNIGS